MSPEFLVSDLQPGWLTRHLSFDSPVSQELVRTKENTGSQKRVFRAASFKQLRLEITPVPINSEMDQQIVVASHNRIPGNNQEVQIAQTETMQMNFQDITLRVEQKDYGRFSQAHSSKMIHIYLKFLT